MKKFFIYALSLVFIGGTFVSCSDDDDDIVTTPINEIPYSSLKPEKQKEKLSYDALELMSELEELGNTKGVGLLTTFVLLSENFFDEEDDEEEGIIEERSLKILSLIDPSIITKLYGIHTWNFETRSFDTQPAYEITFILPGDVNSTKNNGKIEVVPTFLNNDPITMLPEKVAITLYVDEEAAGTIGVDATYATYDITSGTKNFPVKASGSVVVEDYKLTFNADASVSVNILTKAKVEFKKGSLTLMNGEVDVLNDMTSLVMNNNFLPTDGNATINILDNLQVKGKIDVANIKKEKNELDSLEVKEKSEAKVKIYNKYSDVALIARKENNYKIASAQMESVAYTFKDDTKYKEEVAFKFSDDSVVNANVYFSTGFDDVFNAYRQLISWFVPNI